MFGARVVGAVYTLVITPYRHSNYPVQCTVTMADTEMVDLGLDQIIERKNRRGGGGRGRIGGRGPFRGRGGFASGPAPAGSPGPGPRPLPPLPPRNAVWVPTNKILISNLAASVTGADIHELFADHGRIRFSALHHDGVGRSLGTADIVFEREEDAQKAIRDESEKMSLSLSLSPLPPPHPRIKSRTK